MSTMNSEMSTMKITAPAKWLDLVDVAELRAWFIARGFMPLGSHLDRRVGDESWEVLLPAELKEYHDWRIRLIEAIQVAAAFSCITEVEWFMANYPSVFQKAKQ